MNINNLSNEFDNINKDVNHKNDNNYNKNENIDYNATLTDAQIEEQLLQSEGENIKKLTKDEKFFLSGLVYILIKFYYFI